MHITVPEKQKTKKRPDGMRCVIPSTPLSISVEWDLKVNSKNAQSYWVFWFLIYLYVFSFSLLLSS